jgi:tetratricopeptide (TPR) repeat protein
MLLSPRLLPVLRLLIVVSVIGIVVLGVGVVQALLSGGDGTPQTAAERAIVAAEEAVRVNPNDAQARARLGAAYLEQGSTNKAIEQAEIALRLQPEMPEAYLVLGVAHRRLGDLDQAISNLTKAGEADGQFAQFYQEVYVELANAYEEAGDVDAAVGSLERALSFGPENALIVLARAEMLERAGRWEEAAYDFGYVLLFVPDMQEALDGLDRMQEQHPEEYARAMELLDTYIAQIGPAHGGTETTTTP